LTEIKRGSYRSHCLENAL